MEKILVVDDEQSLREVLSIMLKRAGYAVTSVSDGEEAVEQLQKEIFDLVITDLRLPGADGLAVLKAAKEARAQTEVVVITAHGSVETAVGAMKLGAFDYITKPFKMDELLLIVERAGKNFQ